MSTPISICEIVDAFESVEKYKQLSETVRNNIKHYGHYTIFPCDCGKHDKISKEKINKIISEINELAK